MKCLKIKMTKKQITLQYSGLDHPYSTYEIVKQKSKNVWPVLRNGTFLYKVTTYLTPRNLGRSPGAVQSDSFLRLIT